MNLQIQRQITIYHNIKTHIFLKKNNPKNPNKPIKKGRNIHTNDNPLQYLKMRNFNDTCNAPAALTWIHNSIVKSCGCNRMVEHPTYTYDLYQILNASSFF